MEKTNDEPRNGHKKKSKKLEKPAKKKYPFDGDDDLDHVKIELISSFTAKSESSSDDESQSKKAKTNFNLVANDYNSDSDSENKRTIEKHLFAALPSTNAIDPPSVKIYSLKTDLPDNVKVNTTDEPSVVEKPPLVKSKPNTFASIITGGRLSPTEQNTDLIELMKAEVTVEPPINIPSHTEQPVELDAKTFKRKRRIDRFTSIVIL